MAERATFESNVRRLNLALSGELPQDGVNSYFQHTIAALEQRLAELSLAEQALRISEERYRALYDHNPAMYFTVNAQGIVLSVNEFGAQQLGYKAQELTGRSVLEVFVENDRACVARALSECLEQPGVPRIWEFRKQRRDGSVLWVRETMRAVREASGRMIMLIVCEDATALKTSEARIRETTARLNLALDGSNLAIFTWEIDTGAVYLSDRWNEILGGPPAEVLTTLQALTAMVHPDDAETYRERLYEVVRGEATTYRIEHRVRAHNGEWRWISSQGSIAERDRNGHALRLVGTKLDITARKQAENEAHRHAQEFEALYEVTRELALYRDLPGLLNSVVEFATKLLHSAAGSIWQYDTQEGDLVLSVARNSPLPLGVRLKLGEGLAGRVGVTRQPMILDDYRSWEHRVPAFSDKPLHASLAVPLLCHGELIGVLKVCEDQPGVRCYTENDARLLSLLAGPAAVAIERMRAEENLRSSETRFRSLTELSSDWYWEQDEKLRFRRVSGGMLEQAGLKAEEYLGLAPWQLPGIEFCEPNWAEHQQCLQKQQPFRDVVYRIRNMDGRVYYHNISGEPVFDAEGQFRGYRGVGCDVTERVKAEQRIHRLAHYDALSGLPNRILFTQRLQQAISRCARQGKALAVLFMDLDRFKYINDSFGHQAGDRLLQEVAERLSQCLRECDTVARLGGDEFVVLIEGFEAAGEISVVAKKLLATVEQPFLIDGQECHVSGSMGISTYPDDSKDVQNLLRDADVAMYRAKDKGKNTFEFYSAHMNMHALERLAMESSLRRGLERNEFILHYQPKVDLKTGRILSAEALVRWRRPDGTLVPPADFIPLAEECGMIEQLGAWVLRAACMQAHQWQEAGLPPVSVAVNLSARQFLNEGLLSILSDTIAETDTDPALLELEITESLMVRNPEQAAALLHALKLMGVRLALDDFGTGYSSLSYLKRFPFDSVKIDRSFIHDIPHDNDDAAITRAVIAMAHSLRLSVTAEGVESGEQVAFLRENGCDAVQGNYFSAALTADQFEELLRREPHPVQPASR
ncbi:MAG TPA: EAL domain-containing protein [Burkholderiales bacterium]|jgi:diguanylate cyclase (GGDEF)-like protein/PAS domain S-box-containing protein|nr:EAL domain-containing protein [Burkholderiales bacterium]